MASSHDKTFDVETRVLLAWATSDSESIRFFDDHACILYVRVARRWGKEIVRKGLLADIVQVVPATKIMNRTLETLKLVRRCVLDFSFAKIVALTETRVGSTLLVDLKPSTPTVGVSVNDDATHVGGISKGWRVEGWGVFFFPF